MSEEPTPTPAPVPVPEPEDGARAGRRARTRGITYAIWRSAQSRARPWPLPLGPWHACAAPEPECPSLSIGTQTLAGFAHESATDGEQWPAESPALVREIWPILTADFDAGVQQEPVVTRAHALGPHAAFVVALRPACSVAFRWRYQGLEALLGCALGYMPAAFPHALGSGAYRHVYELSPDLASEPWPAADGQPATTRLVRRGTFAAWRQVSTWEMVSGMVQSLALVSDGERVQGEVASVGESLTRESAVNTATTLQALPPYGWPLLSVRHGRLRLGPRSATVALTAEHDVCYRTLEVRLENNLAATAGPRTALAPEEYTRTAPPMLTLSFELPRYASDAWLDAWGADTPLMGEVHYGGPAIGGAPQAYQLTWSLPALRLTDVRPSPIQVGLPSVQHVLQAEVPDAPAAGMAATTLGGPCGVEVVCGVAAHPLLT